VSISRGVVTPSESQPVATGPLLSHPALEQLAA
jgi:hypothetical protein